MAATQENIRQKNLVNVLAKLQRGGTLTVREQALVAVAILLEQHLDLPRALAELAVAVLP